MSESKTISMIPIADLWVSTNPKAWENALEGYWNLVQPRNRALEQSLDTLDLERLRRMDANGWYKFLMEEYFLWKYTDPRRYKTTTNRLRENTPGELDQVRRCLLVLDPEYILSGLKIASLIPGLGAAGASGLLALMYPRHFGTVDQFVVKALRQVQGLPEAEALARMNAEALTIKEGVLIILRRKAADNNRVFKSDAWTPRKLDKVLWIYGR